MGWFTRKHVSDEECTVARRECSGHFVCMQAWRATNELADARKGHAWACMRPRLIPLAQMHVCRWMEYLAGISDAHGRRSRPEFSSWCSGEPPKLGRTRVDHASDRVRAADSCELYMAHRTYEGHGRDGSPCSGRLISKQAFLRVFVLYSCRCSPVGWIVEGAYVAAFSQSRSCSRPYMMHATAYASRWNTLYIQRRRRRSSSRSRP